MDQPASYDRINELPDEMLSINHLPPPNQIWHAHNHPFQAVEPPLALNSPQAQSRGSPAHGDEERLTEVSQILAAHPGPVTSLSIRSFGANYVAVFKLNEWFRSPKLNQLEFLLFQGGQRVLSLPVELPRVFPTLQRARFVHCYFPSMDVVLPLLNLLILTSVGISDKAIERLLGGCLALEHLHLDGAYGLKDCLRIASTTLRSIGLVSSLQFRGVHIQLNQLVNEDAPLLERLSVYSPHGRTTITVISAQRLIVLGYTSKYISKLVVGSPIFWRMFPRSLTSSLRTVKILALDSVGPNLESVVVFLRCFPCTEKLYIETSKGLKSLKNGLKYDKNNPIECLDLHLKELTLNKYQGTPPEIYFAKFFVLNASALKVMRFDVDTEQGVHAFVGSTSDSILRTKLLQKLNLILKI